MALVSSYDRYAELSEKAANAAGAGEEQFEKTLEGIEARTQQLQTSLQNLYTSAGLEELYGGLLGIASNVLEYYNNISAAFGSGMAGAIAAVVTFGAQFYNVAKIVTAVVKLIKAHYVAAEKEITINQKIEAQIRSGETLSIEEETVRKAVEIYRNGEVDKTNITAKELRKRAEAALKEENKLKNAKTGRKTAGSIAYGIGTASSLIGTMIGGETGNWISAGGNALGMIGAFMSGNYIGGIMSLVSSIPSLISAINGSIETTAEKVERLGNAIENADKKQAQSKKALTTLSEYKKKYDELQKSQYQDEEHRKQWVDLNNEIATSYPELIKNMDIEGNYIVDMTTGYQQLAQAKASAYKTDFLNLIKNELTGLKDIDYVLKTIYGINPLPESSGLFSSNAGIVLEVEQPDKEYTLSKENIATIKDIFINPFGDDSSPGGANADIERLYRRYDDGWNQSIAFFKEQASSDIPHSEAVKNAKEKFGAEAPIIQDNIYKYWTERSNAIQFQQRLLDNQIQQYSDEWIHYLQTLTGISSNSLQLDLMSKEIVDEWDNYYELHKNDKKTVDGKEVAKTYGDIFSDFIENNYLPDWYNRFEEATHYLQNETLEKVWQNKGQYTRSQIEAFDWGEQETEILSLYDEEFADTYKQYENRIKYIADSTTADDKAWEGGLISIAKANQEAFAPDYLLDMADNYEKIINVNKENEEAAALGLQQLDLIYSNIGAIDNEDLQRKVMSIISSGDLFSITGIYEVLSQLSTLDWGTDRDIYQLLSEDTLPDLINYLNINVLTNYDLFVDSFSSSLKDLSDALSNAAKGMSLDEALKMADKLNISIADFTFKDGKYYYDKIDIIANKYMANYDVALTKIDEYYDKAISAEGADVESLERARANAHEGIKQSYDYLIKSTLLSAGRIDDFLIDTGITKSTLYANLAQGNVPQQLQSYAKELMDWYNSINDDVYKAFMDSLSNGEWTEIEVTDSNKNLLGQYQKFVQGEIVEGKTVFVNLSQATAEELNAFYNNILVDGTISSKERNSYLKTLDDEIKGRNRANIFKEVINSYQSFDRELAERYAKSLGKNLQDLVNIGIIAFDEINRVYSITWNQIRQQIAELKILETDPKIIAELQDSLTDHLTKFVDLIIKGIQGQLGFTDKENLINLAEDILGEKLNENLFAKTDEGFAFASDKAIEIYHTIYDISEIAAKPFFEALQENLEKAGQDCENIFVTMSSIEKIEKQMSQVSGEENKVLKGRLDLYNKIAIAQMMKPEQYNFMSGSMPSIMQSPINFWENALAMQQKMYEASESGYMDMQDFYNIAMAINSWATEDNPIVFMGKTLNGSFKTAAELLKEGSDALVTTDDGVKVSFEKFGIDFEESANGMSGDVQDGMKAFARSQIEVLDGLINYLETIVAMEELSETGEIDWGKPLFGKDGSNITVQQKNVQALLKIATEADKATGELTDSAKSIQEYLKSVQITDSMNFWDALNIIKNDPEQVYHWSDDMFAAIQQAYNDLAEKVGTLEITDPYNLDEVTKKLFPGGSLDEEQKPTVKEIKFVFTYDGEDPSKFADINSLLTNLAAAGAGETVNGEIQLVDGSGATISYNVSMSSAEGNLVEFTVGGQDYSWNPVEDADNFETWLTETWLPDFTEDKGLSILSTGYDIPTEISGQINVGDEGSSISYTAEIADGGASATIHIGNNEYFWSANGAIKDFNRAVWLYARLYAREQGTLSIPNQEIEGKTITIKDENSQVIYTGILNGNGTITWEDGASLDSGMEEFINQFIPEFNNIDADGITLYQNNDGSYTVELENIGISGNTNINYKFTIKPKDGSAAAAKQAINEGWTQARTDIAEIKSEIDDYNFPEGTSGVAIESLGPGQGYQVTFDDVSIGGNSFVNYSMHFSPTNTGLSAESFKKACDEAAANITTYKDAYKKLMDAAGITNLGILQFNDGSLELSAELNVGDGISITWHSLKIIGDTPSEVIQGITDATADLQKWKQGVEDFNKSADEALVTNPNPIEIDNSIHLIIKDDKVYFDNGPLVGNAYTTLSEALDELADLSEISYSYPLSSLPLTQKEVEWNAQHEAEEAATRAAYASYLKEASYFANFSTMGTPSIMDYYYDNKPLNEIIEIILAYEKFAAQYGDNTPWANQEEELKTVLGNLSSSQLNNLITGPDTISDYTINLINSILEARTSPQQKQQSSLKEKLIQALKESEDNPELYSKKAQALSLNALYSKSLSGENFDLATWVQGSFGNIEEAKQFFDEIGVNFSEGVLEGMLEGDRQVYSKELVDNIIEAIEDYAQVGSPAKLFYPTGDYMVQGLAEGMKEHDFTSEAIAIVDNFEAALKIALENKPLLASLLNSSINFKTSSNLPNQKDTEQQKNLFTNDAQERLADNTETIITILTNSDIGLNNLAHTTAAILNEMPDKGKFFSLSELATIELKASVHGDFWGEGNQLVLTNGEGGNTHFNLQDYVRQINELFTSGELENFQVSIPLVLSNAGAFYTEINNAIAKVQNKTINVKVIPDTSEVTNMTFTVNVQGGGEQASQAKGNAQARGTLMGELGPELYVTGGHYYVAGQNGAEFVDLPDDAIVFNHLQTKRLMSTGSAGRGKAVTNEKNATSYATGNVAMASAADTLSTLKQVRAMWQALLDMSFKDLATKGGGGGGGNKSNAAFIGDLERWYNLLRQIEKAEKQINYEEQLRSKIQSDRIINGKALYASQKRQLEALDEEIQHHQELAALQRSYYKERLDDLRTTKFPHIFDYVEKEGLLQFVNGTMINGDKGGLAALADLMATDVHGKPKYTAKEQYEKLLAWGFGEEMKYNDSGELIDVSKDEGYATAVEAFWNRNQSWIEELDELSDSIIEQEEKILDTEEKSNKILQEIVDNQREVEDKILEAIEAREQAVIDKLQDTYDALSDAAEKYVDGLNDALTKEREMYQKQQNDSDLVKLQRRLAILQRSGGSGAEILSLQKQIDSQLQDRYFEQQQSQIDAIKEASDNELEKLQQQIDIATETLEYAKENGLLWREVYDVMARNPEDIVSFITEHSKDWSSKSTLAQSEELRTLTSMVEQWSEYYRDTSATELMGEQGNRSYENWRKANMDKYYDKVWEENKLEAKEIYAKKYAETGDSNKAAVEAEMFLNEKMSAYKKAHPEEFPKEEEPKEEEEKKTGGGDGGLSTFKEVQAKWNEIKYKFNNAVSNYNKTPLGFQNWYDANNKWGITWDNLQEARHKSEFGASVYATAFGEWQAYTNNFEKNRKAQQENITALYNELKRLLNGYPEALKGYELPVLPTFDRGGMVNETGLALVHAKEGVITPDQVDLLRDLATIQQQLYNSHILDSIRDNWRHVLNSIDDSANNSITIENATVEMNVQSIANDYDARRAAQMALDEMLAIARKTSVQSIRR